MPARPGRPGGTPGTVYALNYDITGRPVQGSKGLATQTSGYNTLGQRVSRTVVGGSQSGVQLYAYDEQGRPLGVYTPDASEPTGFRVVEEYVHLDGWRPVAVVRPNATSGMANPDIHPILTDHLGTPRKVLDASTGQTRWEWDAKEPFGHQAPNQTPTAGLPALTLDLRFPGQRYDEATGLFQNGFRDYHAGLGRYVESDPLGLVAGWNTYGYVGSNPSSRTDPYGLACNGMGCWNTKAELAYARTGNYGLYYQAACAGGDSYACAARTVATGEANSISGLAGARFTNGNLRTALRRGGSDCPDQDMENIRKDLMSARVAQLSNATPGRPYVATGQSIADFHNSVFNRYGATDGWGPFPVFGGDIHFMNIGNTDAWTWCSSPACQS